MAFKDIWNSILGRTDTANTSTSTSSDSNVRQEQSTVSQGSQTSQTGNVQASQSQGTVQTLDEGSLNAIQQMLQGIAGGGVLGGQATQDVLNSLSSAAGDLTGGAAARDTVTSALSAINQQAQNQYQNTVQQSQRNFRTQAGTSLNSVAQAGFDRSAAEAASTFGATNAQAALAAEELLSGLDASRISGLSQAAGTLSDVGGAQTVDAVAALGNILKGATVQTDESARAESAGVTNTEQQLLEFLRTLQEGKTTQVSDQSGTTNQGFDLGDFLSNSRFLYD